MHNEVITKSMKAVNSVHKSINLVAIPLLPKHQTRPGRDVHLRNTATMSCDLSSDVEKYPNLQPIFPAVPFHWGREVFSVKVDPVESAKPLFVTGKDHMVFARLLDANAIIGERLCWMEVEYEQKTGTFEDNDFVDFVFQRYVGLVRNASIRNILL